MRSGCEASSAWMAFRGSLAAYFFSYDSVSTGSVPDSSMASPMTKFVC